MSNIDVCYSVGHFECFTTRVFGLLVVLLPNMNQTYAEIHLGLCKADPIAPASLMAASTATVWEAKIEALKKRKLVAPTSLTAFKAAHMGSVRAVAGSGLPSDGTAWMAFELLSYSYTSIA